MMPKDELRGAYNEFLLSPLGKDFLTRIVAYEAQLQAEAFLGNSTAEKKLSNVDKLSALYWVRTQLDDLSKPKPEPLKRSTPVSQRKRTQSSGQ